jgi:hypothetical protein
MLASLNLPAEETLMKWREKHDAAKSMTGLDDHHRHHKRSCPSWHDAIVFSSQAGGELFPVDAERSFSAFEFSCCKMDVNVHVIDTKAITWATAIEIVGFKTVLDQTAQCVSMMHASNDGLVHCLLCHCALRPLCHQVFGQARQQLALKCAKHLLVCGAKRRAFTSKRLCL